MSGIQMKTKPHRVDKPIPGCLGRMVNLFDLASTKNRLLTDKPHNDGSSLSRSRSDISRMCTTVGNELLDDEVSESKCSSLSKTPHGTPVKMLLAQDMSKDLESRQNSPNLVAKLMGLDVLPQPQPDSAAQRSHSQWYTQNSHADNYWQEEHGFFPEQSDFEDHPSHDESDYKDIYEIWEQSQTKNCIRDKSLQKGSCNENVTEKKLAFIRQKFMEAKRLATDEKLRQSEEFQDALSVLSANGELFLKVLQEPNSLFSHHLFGVQSIPSSPDAKRITVLKPSAMVHDDKLATPTRRTEKVAKKQLLQVDLWENHHMSKWKANDSPAQPTRIVVLKPSLAKVTDAKAVISSAPSTPRTQPREEMFSVEHEDEEAREVAKEITQQMRENLTGHRRDETLLSSVLSNGYTGDESSCDKSESEFATGNLSDSEVMSATTSRHSWDYGNRHGSPCSSFTRVSYSPESSVSREAKRRLSERWAMIASSGRNQEQKSIKKSSSTLGEMLALFEVEEPGICEEAAGSGNASPRSLVRSKSLPVSSTVYGERLNAEVSKTKATKSSFTGKVTSLFFSKSKKPKKEKPGKLKSNDESQSATADSPCSLALSGRTSSDQSEVILSQTSELRSGSNLGDPNDRRYGPGICSQQEGLWLSQSGTRGIQGDNLEQPSPISVLDPPSFEEDDNATLGCSSRSLQQNTYGRFLSKSNLIDKSPPIGSIARTLSWDERHAETASSYPFNSPFVSTVTEDEDEDEEAEWRSLVQSLLTTAGLDDKVQQLTANVSKFHSPESPLDPTLKDRFIDLTNKEPIMHEARRRKLRSTRKLVFDIVNATLVDMTDVRTGTTSSSHRLSGPHKHELTGVEDEAWARVKEWVSGNVKGDGGNSSSLVEWEVWKEVVGHGWAHQIRVEVDNIGKEIERMLLQELVEESLLQWRTT